MKRVNNEQSRIKDQKERRKNMMKIEERRKTKKKD